MAQAVWTSSCCNPLELPSHSGIKKNLRPVTKWMCKKVPKILMGSKVCDSCRKKLKELPDIPQSEVIDSDHTAEADDDYVVEPLFAINHCLTEIGETPIVKKKLRHSKYPEKKIEKITAAVKKAMLFDEQVGKNPDSVGSEMIDQLKDKFLKTESRSEKLQVLTVLPKSWSLARVQQEFGVSKYTAMKAKELVQEKGILATPDPKPGHSLAPNTVELVHGFYNSDEVSRVMPGMKDFVSVKENGQRVHKQKRLILSNLKECYQFFKEKFPTEKVGFSKFAELRPKQCVLAGASGTHSVCVCTIHQNVKLMILAAKLPNLTAHKSLLLQTYHHCLAHIVCNPAQPMCYFGNCNSCPGTSKLYTYLLNLLDENMIENVTFKQWVSVDRSTLETFTLPADEFVEQFIGKLNILLPHSFLSVQQASFYQECKLNLKPREVLVTADFSENYAFVLQDAAQGFHWNNTQATIHPFVAYYVDSGELRHLSYVVISDCLHHDTIAVYLFQKKFISHLLASLSSPPLKIRYFSDGAASQYKNRKNFINLCHHEEDFGIPAEWHFSATSHGKGACDGLGGTVKRLAARASLQKPYEEQIMTPRQLFQWASSNISATTFKYCTKDEYLAEEITLSTRFEKCRTIPGTRKLHSFVPITTQKLRTQVFSTSTKAQVQWITSRHDGELEVEEISGFITFIRSEQWWLGCIVDYDEECDEARVNVLHPHGPARSFQYPAKQDVVKISRSDFLAKVDPTAGYVYRLTQKDKNYITERYHQMML